MAVYLTKHWKTTRCSYITKIILFFQDTAALNRGFKGNFLNHILVHLIKRTIYFNLKNVLTPERWGYREILLKSTSPLPLQLHFLQWYDSADGSFIFYLYFRFCEGANNKRVIVIIPAKKV